MKTQIKQLLYGILATSCFGLSCTSLTWAVEEYHWPPKDGEPMVTLVGPVYETGSETQAPLFKALEQAMTAIVENQQTHLPEFYQKRIAGMNHQLFRPGYSNDEEWGSIKSLGSKADDYDTERIAGILESSENRKPGLEMAIRMQPTIETQPASVTLEGYRFVLKPSGKGQAEWFTQEVKLKGRSPDDAFQNALIWQLSKPFEKAQKTFVLDDLDVPVWKDKNTAGVLTFADKQFTADAEPIRKETMEVCVHTRFCPTMKVEGDEFALVSNIMDAHTICRIFGRELIDKETLLRLSLTEEGSNLLDEENGAAWHSGRESGHFGKSYNHYDFISNGSGGVVWCGVEPNTPPVFEERPKDFLLERIGLSLTIYKSLIFTNFTLEKLKKRYMEILKGDEVFVSEMLAELTPEGLSRSKESWEARRQYVRLGSKMLVEWTEKDKNYPVDKVWIVKDFMATDVKEDSVLLIRNIKRNISGLTWFKTTLNLSIAIEKWSQEEMSFVFEEWRSINADLYKLGYISITRYGSIWSWGVNDLVLNEVTQTGRDNEPGPSTYGHTGYIFFNYGIEKPLRILPNANWQAFIEFDYLNVSNYYKGSHNIPLFSVEARLHYYIMGEGRSFELFIGNNFSFGNSGRDFFKGLFNDTSESFVIVKKGNSFTSGLNYLW
jgi:hypothetical protein